MKTFHCDRCGTRLDNLRFAIRSRLARPTYAGDPGQLQPYPVAAHDLCFACFFALADLVSRFVAEGQPSPTPRATPPAVRRRPRATSN